jgi:hypothetical protein
LSQNNNIITVEVAADVVVQLQAIVTLIVQLCADLQVSIKAGVSATDIQGCGNTFILLVNLLVSILFQISRACQSGKWRVNMLSLLPRYERL